MGNGALPNGPSYRAYPRLYQRAGSRNPPNVFAPKRIGDEPPVSGCTHGARKLTRVLLKGCTRTISVFSASRYRAPARQSRSTAPKKTLARAAEPILSAVHWLVCRGVGSLHKGRGARLGAGSSQACLARSSVSRPPAHSPKGR